MSFIEMYTNLTLSQYDMMLKRIEHHDLMSGRLRSVQSKIEGLRPLMDLADGDFIRIDKASQIGTIDFDEAGVPLTITKIWFGLADDNPNERVDGIGELPPFPGVEFRSMGGTVRVNSLEQGGTLDRMVNSLKRYVQIKPGILDVELMNAGHVTIEPQYKVVTVEGGAEPQWGTFAGDLDCGLVRNARSGKMALVIWEGWRMGQTVVVTNPNEFIAKLDLAARDITRQIYEWKTS